MPRAAPVTRATGTVSSPRAFTPRVYDAAYRYPVYELPSRPRPLPPLVRATTELRTLIGVLAGLGALLLAGALALGDVRRLSPLEVADVILVFGLSTGSSA